jgi:hypothetical protein
MDSRAAVFTSSPQAVEVFQAGTWWAGELLGWRHDASGTCQMWVRVVVGGVEETAWTDLAALRLPDPDPAPVAGPGRMDSRVKQVLPPAQAISALRGRAPAADATATAALPAVRNGLPFSGEAGDAARPSGRRRAPETVQEEAVAVDAATATAVDPAGPSGRHRAPDDEGRHRAADTEVFAAVSDATEQLPAVQAAPALEPRRAARPHVGAGWSVPSARTARPEESYGRSEVCTGRIDPEPDLLTRPMRLSDLAPHSRRPRVGGSLPV